MSTAAPLDRIGVGIDTARYGHRVSFLGPDRRPAAKPLTVTEDRAGYRSLQDQLDQLHEQYPDAKFHVRIDAAGQYAANLEAFLRGLELPLIIPVGEPRRNKDYQKAHFPKRTTDDTESQAMARFAVVEQPEATPAPSRQMVALREVAGRLRAKVKQTTRAIDQLHNLMARAFPELATLTADISAGWVLTLLEKYPTAERVAAAHLASLEKIPYLPAGLAAAVHEAAKRSVASLTGEHAEAPVREEVAQVRSCRGAERGLRELLVAAFDDLPGSAHTRILTVIGIGRATAAALVAKVVDIDRFATPEDLVGYFGIFPEENSSGVDKRGRPLPAGTLAMSRKGNDLVRAYLWNAARSAIVHNPAVRALYHRLKSKGKRGDVAIGHCMRKLLHQAYAVWKTDKDFDKDYSPPEAGRDTAAPPPPTPLSDAEVVPSLGETAVGHKRDSPAKGVVTTATSTVGSAPPPVKSEPRRIPAGRPGIDFAYLREQVSIEQVLEHMGSFAGLSGRGQQRRGPCPVHGHPGDGGRTFSVHLGKDVFRCFHADCGHQGNVLDLWAAIHRLSPYDAALHLAETFGLALNREEEPVTGPSRPRPAAARSSAPVTVAPARGSE